MIRPQEYDQSKAISQSDLKLMRSNIQEFYKRKIMCIAKTREEEEAERKTYYDVGDLTDVMFLQPELKSQFYTMPNVTLGEKFKLLMDALYEAVTTDLKEMNAHNEDIGAPLQELSKDVNDYLHYVESAAKKALYYYNPEKDKPWSRTLDTITAEVKTTGAVYFEALASAFGKRVVNVVNWNTAVKCVEKIKTSNNRNVNRIVNLIEAKFSGNLDEHIEVFLAHPFYGLIEGVKLKCLVDIAIIDHSAKTVLVPDLKTTKSILSFPASYKSFGYGKQVVLYSHVVSQNYPGYKILPAGFIVVGTDPELEDRAEYFELSPKEMEIQYAGGTYQSGTTTVSILDDLKTYQWHVSNNEWNRYPQHANENDAFILETSGIAEVNAVPEEPEEIF